MKIAYNPLGKPLDISKLDKNVKDGIIFDLNGLSVYAKGIRFKGTDTTYSVFKKNTSDTGGGYNGLVPVPNYNNNSKTRYLREDGTWVIPTNTNDKVLQSKDTTSNFRPIILGYDNDANKDKILDNQTAQVYTAANIYALPSTGNLYANKFIGHTNWSTIDNKPSSFIPSEHTHKYAGSNKSGGAAYQIFEYTDLEESLNNLNKLIGDSYCGKLFYDGGSNTTAHKPSGVDAYGTLIFKAADGYTAQLLASSNTSNGLYFRCILDGTTGDWHKVAYITDNVASATKLKTARKINGVEFDGTKDITIKYNTTHIETLEGYTIATKREALKTSDTLNSALGKLEFNVNLGLKAYDLVYAANKEGTIDNLTEILKVLNGINDTDTIKNLLGKYLPLSGGFLIEGAEIKLNNYNARFNTLSGNLLLFDTSLDDGGWAGGIYLKDSKKTHPILNWNGSKGVLDDLNILNLIKINTNNITINSNIDINAGRIILTSELKSKRGVFTEIEGKAPMIITSTTLVNNLNADLLDGKHLLDIINDTDTKIKNLLVGCRNYYTLTSNISGITIIQRDLENLVYKPILDRTTRINNVITSNGWWTVSGYVKSDSTVSGHIDICDTLPYKNMTVGTEWVYFTHTSYIDRFDSTYHFVDLELSRNSSKTIYIKNLKIEKGFIATDWTPAPSDKADVNGNKLEPFYASKFIGNLQGNADSASAIKKNGASIIISDDYGIYLANSIGNLKMGPLNGSYCHIYTDSPSFYFNKKLLILGNEVFHEGNAWTRNAGINGTNWSFLSSVAAGNPFMIYAPTTAGTAGQVLLSSGGTKAPIWVDLITAGVIKIEKTLTLTTEWQDTGIVLNSATIASGLGSYIILVSRGTSYVWTGYATLRIDGNATNSYSDEIIMHGGGFDDSNSVYLRTTNDATNKCVKLQIAYTINDTGSHTWTFKFKRII